MSEETLEFRACWVCGRTILRGERVRSYLTPEAEAADVCALCVSRAESGGWVPAEAGELALLRGQDRRGRSIRERLRGSGIADRLRTRDRGAARQGDEHGEPDSGEPAEEAPQTAGRRRGRGAEPELDEPEPEPEPDEPEAPRQDAPLFEGFEDELEDPLPTGSRREEASGTEPEVPDDDDPEDAVSEPSESAEELESQRRRRAAVEAFNRSEARRKVAGLIRSLGAPAVSVRHMPGEDERVALTVAWELTWYQWECREQGTRVEISEVKRGQEVEELSDNTREWNARAGEDGRLRLGAVAAP